MIVNVVSDTIQEFNGKRYYLCGNYFQRKGVRLHRVVWEATNGAVPTGWHVHHLDHNKRNNNLGNLELSPQADHLSHHANTPERLVAKREHMLKTMIPKAAEWHRSDEGRRWHSENAKASAAKWVPVDLVCEVCTASFQSVKKTTKYCSAKCGDTARRRAKGILPPTAESKKAAALKGKERRRLNQLKGS